MSSKQISCPSCGAPSELKYRFSKTVVCEYCGQTTHLTSENATNTNVKSGLLTDYGSKFALHQTIRINQQKYEILGRLRFSYPSGFWDEWFLINPQNSYDVYWLQEDEGEYILFKRHTGNVEFPDFASTKVGQIFDADGDTIFVNEKNTAEVLGGEGELPFEVIPGEQANFVDGIVVKKGMPVSYEYLPTETLLYIGQDIKLDYITIES